MAAENMGLDILTARVDGKMSGFRRAQAEAQCMGMADDEIWETVNPGLDRFLRFGRSSDDVVSVVCGREMGVEGFCGYLTYLVKEKGIGGGLLKGKVKVLINAINKLNGIFSCKKSLIITPLPRSRVSNANIPQSSILEPHQDIVENNGTSAQPINIDSDVLVDCSVVVTTPPGCPKPCTRVHLSLPSGVSPYSAYPFKLHDKFPLPWDIHITNHQLWVQLIHCLRVAGQDGCCPCCELFLNDTMKGILHHINDGIHQNMPLVYQSIKGLIELIRCKTQALDALQFTKLTMA